MAFDPADPPKFTEEQISHIVVRVWDVAGNVSEEKARDIVLDKTPPTASHTLTPGKDGLLHISRVANGRVGKVEDVLNLGDIIKVEVLEVDPKTGKISLDRLDKPDAPESSASNGERRERGDRNGGRDNRPGRSGREGNGGGNRTPRRRHDA